jgi:Tfp pilus assembly protein FimT
LDLLLSVLVLSILVLVALPSLTGVTTASTLDEATRELTTALDYARVLAVENQRPFGLTVSLSLNRFEVFDSLPPATPPSGGSGAATVSIVQNPHTQQAYVVDFDDIPSCRGARLLAAPAAARVLFYADGHTADPTAQSFAIGVGTQRRTVIVEGMTGVVTVE